MSVVPHAQPLPGDCGGRWQLEEIHCVILVLPQIRRVALGASREAWREGQSWQAVFLGAQAWRKQSGVKVVQ